jgi:hypothetical protein
MLAGANVVMRYGTCYKPCKPIVALVRVRIRVRVSHTGFAQGL